VLDLKMPHKTGFDVLEFLRTRPSSLVTVVLSDSSAECDKDRARALGAAEYFVKPDGLTGLIELIPRLETIWLHTLSAPRILARPRAVAMLRS
jgi:DNA-binding response OmpR family regulator